MMPLAKNHLRLFDDGTRLPAIPLGHFGQGVSAEIGEEGSGLDVNACVRRPSPWQCGQSVMAVELSRNPL